MKRPKQTDKECRRQGMTDVPVANYSKMQDKYIDYLEKKLKNNSVLDDVSKQRELLKAFIDFYNYRNTGDKTIYNDEIEIFIDSL
tara:strand:+ start:238 stop:492 length:255 start_codon:yes stop_codon:yes gene_type:complete